MGVKRGFAALWIAVLGLGLSLGLAVPAQAQLRSDSAKFLEAVKKRDGDTVMALLGEPGNTLVNTRDLGNGETALHVVTQRRDLAWIQFLLQRGANPNQGDARGVTPLQIAATTGFVEGAEALALGGANLDVPDQTGETPLIAAVHRRDLAMVRLLLARGANPARSDNSGRSAQDYARLMKANTSLLEVFEAAAKERAGKAKTYGPN